jgi:hypothetical protein
MIVVLLSLTLYIVQALSLRLTMFKGSVSLMFAYKNLLFIEPVATTFL